MTSDSSENWNAGSSRRKRQTSTRASGATRMVSMSTDGTASARAAGTAAFSASMIDGVAMGLRRHALHVDFLLQLDDAVDERLGTGRAPRHEHVDGHDLVDA